MSAMVVLGISNFKHEVNMTLDKPFVQLSFLFFLPKRSHFQEMAHLPYLHHGYFPRGRTKQLPWVTKSTAPGIPFETSSNPATRAEETNLLEKQQPVKELATLLRKIR